jgi:hypothetical protein
VESSRGAIVFGKYFRWTIHFVAVALFSGVVGCGSNKSDGISNPDLQVPDVPPSDRSTKSPLDAK